MAGRRAGREALAGVFALAVQPPARERERRNCGGTVPVLGSEPISVLLFDVLGWRGRGPRSPRAPGDVRT